LARRLIEAVPNFSEGRSPRVIEQIAEAIAEVEGLVLLDQTSDPDHHRSVITFAGDPDAVCEGGIRAAGKAAELIDLTKHRGVHPRLGACDVLPFVPVEGVTLSECAALAHRAGRQIWDRYGVPVYFYEAAALDLSRRRLEDVRRGGFERVQHAPDIGGALHPTAGATITGARKFLIAYNINLATPDVGIAKSIAVKIRASSGGLPCVKAMGLYLAGRDCAQVSVNLTDFETTSLGSVFNAVQAEAASHGVEIAGSELIGLIPQRALDSTFGLDLRWENFTESSILENRLSRALTSN